VCSCRVYAESAPEVVALRPGTLDDFSWVRPAAELWTCRALPWARHEGLTSHEGNAPDFAEISRSWRAQGIRFI
jgi:hypothetical protein